MTYEEAPPGYHYIFRPYITGKNGQRIYPRNGRVFKLLVKN